MSTDSMPPHPKLGQFQEGVSDNPAGRPPAAGGAGGRSVRDACKSPVFTGSVPPCRTYSCSTRWPWGAPADAGTMPRRVCHADWETRAIRRQCYILADGAPPTSLLLARHDRPPRHRHRPAQPNPRRRRGQHREAFPPRRREEAAALDADLVVGTELCVSGYPPEESGAEAGFSSKPARPRCTTSPRRRRADPPFSSARPWRARWKNLQRGAATRPRRDRSGALQVRSAQLRGLRRESASSAAGPGAGTNRVFAGSGSASWYVRTCGSRTRTENPRRDRRRAAHRHQRLALRARQARRAHRFLPARRIKGERAAAALRQPRSAAKDEDRLRGRLLRARRRLPALPAGARKWREGGAAVDLAGASPTIAGRSNPAA